MLGYKVKNKLNQVANETTDAAISATYGTVTSQYSGINETTITLSSFIVTVAGANLGVGLKIGTFPKGMILTHKIIHNLTATAHTGCTINPEFGLGTVIASGAITQLSAGSATMEDIMDGTQLGALTEGSAKAYGNLCANAELDIKDGSSTAKDIYLNLAGNWSTSGTVTITGTVKIFWQNVTY